LKTPEGQNLYVLCRTFHKLPSEFDNESLFMMGVLLEGIRRENEEVKRKMQDMEDKFSK